jgi:hypothetical protein
MQFVQCLLVSPCICYSCLTIDVKSRANPWYLNHLATQKLLDNPTFLAYLSYLQYFSQPEYTKYLTLVSAYFPKILERTNIGKISGTHAKGVTVAAAGKIQAGYP